MRPPLLLLLREGRGGKTLLKRRGWRSLSYPTLFPKGARGGRRQKTTSSGWLKEPCTYVQLGLSSLFLASSLGGERAKQLSACSRALALFSSPSPSGPLGVQ